jgi:hypothetical protein
LVRTVVAEATEAVAEVSTVATGAGIAAQEEMGVAEAPEGYIPGMEAVAEMAVRAAEPKMGVADCVAAE